MILRTLILFALGIPSLGAMAQEEAAPAPTPTPVQRSWQDAEFGVVFHYDLHTCAEGRYVQSKNRITPFESTDHFSPDELDTDQWIRGAKAAGARFAILTASHETGFRLWQSEVNPFCLRAVKWGGGKRDILGEFYASCQKFGIKPGVYLGTRWNAKLGVFDFKVTARSSITQAEYNRLIEQEVEEVCTRYGPWFEFWFDGGAHGPEQGGPDVLSVIEQHQPQTVFYHSLQRADARWGGSESGTVPYPCWATFPFPVTGAGESARTEIAANGYSLLKRGDPEGAFWLPAMSDAPLRGHGGHEWFWEPNDEKLIYPLKRLVDMYCRSVGHNSTLILGLTPDDRGLLPDADMERLEEFGQTIRSVFEQPLAQTSQTTIGERVELPLSPNQSFDTVVIQEDISQGERVRNYELQILRQGQWTSIGEGSCIGHKRIHRLDAVVRGDRLRLIVHEKRAVPHILRLAIHRF